MPFNYEEFSAKCDGLTEAELQKQWENYTGQLAGGSASTAVSILAAPLTGGVSLLGLGLSTPRIHNARKKREIIEEHLQALDSTHHTRKRDILGPMALSSTIGALTVGMAPGTDTIAQVGIGHGICTLVENTNLVEAAAHVALDGAGAGVEEIEHKRKEKKEKKKLKREQEAMLRQFQRWKAEEEAMKIALAEEKMEETKQMKDELKGEKKGPVTKVNGDPPPAYVEMTGKAVNKQKGSIAPVAVVEELSGSESSDDEEIDISNENEMSFEDYLEIKKMWAQKNASA